MTLTFDQIARERNRDQIVAETLVLTDVLHEALIGAFAPPQESEAGGATAPETDPETVARMSLEQFRVAVSECIPKWAAGETTLLPNTTLSRAKVAKQRIEEKLLKEGEELGEEPTSSEATLTKKGSKMPTTKPKFTNRDEVVREVNKLARELMAKDPKLSLSQARSKIWKDRPDLASAYKELPKGPEVKVAGAVRKGDSTLRKVREKAQELRKADPELSPVQARMRVWETHPELAEEYQREIR